MRLKNAECKCNALSCGFQLTRPKLRFAKNKAATQPARKTSQEGTAKHQELLNGRCVRSSGAKLSYCQ